MRYFLTIILFLLIIPALQSINASPSVETNDNSISEILISKSETIEKVIFDGKWTESSEWKQSSWDIITPQGMESIHLRSAHQGDYIYILLDAVADQTIDHISDKALVCIDGKNDKTIIPGDDDYCFQASLNEKEGFIFQGGSPLALNTHFEKISNTNGFIGIGNESDLNDKYSSIPHASYEFKIPIDLFGRSDIYGFYFYVYDASESTFYSWPDNATPSNSLDIPTPSKWGLLVSPDKSIPEFELPLLALIPAMFLGIYLSRVRAARLEDRNNLFTKAKKSLVRK